MKHAINYITVLADLVSRNPGDATVTSPPVPEPKKFFVRSTRTGFTEVHSLSWSSENDLPLNGNVMVTKLWTPEDPRSNQGSSGRISCVSSTSSSMDGDSGVFGQEEMTIASPGNIQSSGTPRSSSSSSQLPYHHHTCLSQQQEQQSLHHHHHYQDILAECCSLITYP